MAGSNQYVDPVQVEVVGDLGAEVTADGTLPPHPPPTGMGILGLEAATGLMFVPRVNALGQWIVVFPGGAPIFDTDDNAVAEAQVPQLVINENYIDNGSVWIRQQGGTDNVAFAGAPQGSFVGGTVTDPLDVFVDGDTCILHFDTTGRLLVDAEGVTDTDDNSIAQGQLTSINIPLNYMDNGIAWIRMQGGVDNAVATASPQGLFVGGTVTDPLDVFVDGDVCLLHFDTSGRLLVDAEGITDTDDNSIAEGQVTGINIPLNYMNDGTAWIRMQGGVDNAVATGSPQGLFVAGIVTDPLDVYTDGDVSFFHFDTSGRVEVAVTISEGSTVTSPADTAVGIGLTVALTVPPAGTKQVTVQNTSVAGVNVRIRKLGGTAGTGILLPPFSTRTFERAVASLEAQHVAGAAGATVAIQFED